MGRGGTQRYKHHVVLRYYLAEVMHFPGFLGFVALSGAHWRQQAVIKETNLTLSYLEL